ARRVDDESAAAAQHYCVTDVSVCSSRAGTQHLFQRAERLAIEEPGQIAKRCESNSGGSEICAAILGLARGALTRRKESMGRPIQHGRVCRHRNVRPSTRLSQHIGILSW